MRHLSTVLTALLLVLPTCAWAQPAEPQPETRPFYVPINLSFEDVDLERLQQRLAGWGIEVPLELSGTASTTISGRLPLGSLGDAKAYRFSGTLTSEQLTISGVELRELSASAAYEEGVLVLDWLRFQVPPEQEGGPLGTFMGERSAEVC